MLIFKLQIQRRLNMKRILLISAVFVLGLLAVSSPAQPPDSFQEKGQASLKHNVIVTLKLIHVIVTDRGGNPIPDLAREDFLVSDNGKEQKITEFERHALNLPGPDNGAIEPKPTTAPLSKSLLGRKFFLLFDTVLADVKGFGIAKNAALHFIQEDLSPDDEVAVLSFSGGRNLLVHKYLTQDRAAAVSAVEALTLSSLAVKGNDNGEVVGPVYITGDGVTEIPVVPSGPSRIIAGNFVWAMRSLAQATRSVSGKKHLILCSNGIQGAVIGRGEFANGRNTDLSRDYEEMCRELAASNISVYPVNTADINIGLQRVDQDRWREGQTGVPSLREIASHTGGRFLGAAGNSSKQIDDLNRLTGTYYVLGYPIGQTWDGKFHKIRVRVRRPGAEVNAQPGYFNPKQFADYTELEMKIDLVDLALADTPLSQEPVRFSMHALPGVDSPAANVHYIAEISTAGLGEVAGRQVEFVSMLFDGLDQIIDIKRDELDLTAEALGDKRAFIFSSLSAPTGTYKCRIVLRNLLTGRAAVAGSALSTPDRALGNLRVFPPLFLVSSPEALYLGRSDTIDDQGQMSSIQARVAQALLFDPKKFSLYPDGPIPKHSSVFALLECAAANGDTSNLSLSASLTDESAGTESEIPLAILAEKGGNGAKAFFLRLEIPEVEWGAYLLSLTVTDRSNNHTFRVTKVISIEASTQLPHNRLIAAITYPAESSRP
jgi:VWFA-related protein